MRILVFGATGSIGSQVLNTIKKLNYQLVGISFYHNAKAARKIKAPYCYSPIDDQNSNVHDYRELIGKSKPDLIVNAVVGSAGLRLTLLTIEKGIDLALANKESIVMAGQFIMPLAKKKHVNIYPIDSEHSALYKIIQMYGNNYKKIYITASGGPFYHYTTEEIKRVTFKRAIKHPKWNMGTKVSIDSATLVNKSLEIIEAYWYFNTKKIQPLYHPNAMIHAIIEYLNRSYAFVAKPNMAIAIELALTKFKHYDECVVPFDFKKTTYKLEKIDPNRYIPIRWAYDALLKPKSALPVIINTADETLVTLFAHNKIKFHQIVPIIDMCINKFKYHNIHNLNDIYNVNEECNLQIFKILNIVNSVD